MGVSGPDLQIDGALIRDHQSNIVGAMTDQLKNYPELHLLVVRMDDKDDGPPVGNDRRGDNDIGVVVQTKPKTKKPAMYKVIMLNDDYTPMEFVILVLERFFNKGEQAATRIMLHVHQKGVGVCGVFTYEVAETKVQQVMDLAQQHQHPLQCTLEKA